MKIMMTGANGTVGKVLSSYLETVGHSVCVWDREQVPIDNYDLMESFIKNEMPDVFFHLAIASNPTGKENESWLVNYEWSSEISWITKNLNIVYVFVSTVLVFSDNATGPFAIESIPDAKEGYGYEKRMAEAKVYAQNPKVRIARLGWQIGKTAGSNNMIDFFEQEMRTKQQIRASDVWYPACSFLEDTVKLLLEVMLQKPGIYMIDSNSRWSFYQIACALNQLHGNNWNIVVDNSFVYDQRMKDESLSPISLQNRLPDLP